MKWLCKRQWILRIKRSSSLISFKFLTYKSIDFWLTTFLPTVSIFLRAFFPPHLSSQPRILAHTSHTTPSHKMRFSTSSACGLVALLISSSPLIWANPVPVPVPSDFALAPAASEVAPSPPPEVAATAVPAALNGRSTIVKRNYAGSCRLCGLGSSNPNIFSCICRRADQSETLSTLNLNNCLGNSDGHLVWWRKYVTPRTRREQN